MKIRRSKGKIRDEVESAIETFQARINNVHQWTKRDFNKFMKFVEKVNPDIIPDRTKKEKKN